MNIELKILDWFQTLHTPVLDKFMTSVTKLGNAGIFWIILTVLFLLIPKMRKTGVVWRLLDHRFIIMQRIVKKFRGADQTV